MKVLFVMTHPAYVRSYGRILRLLADRGHHVHLVFRRIKTGESLEAVRRIAEECPGVTYGALPGRSSPGFDRNRRGWDALAERLRFSIDYLRYLEPAYADASGLRARAERRAQPFVRRAARLLRPAGTHGVRLFRHALEAVERSIVPPPHVERFVVDQEPDVVLVSHLADLGSSQSPYIRAANRLGIHTAYPVFSWDNLTNKGLIHDRPELTLVWNDLQSAEATELQGLPPEQVEVTGAPAYDHWFDWKPSRSRAEFCREVGLREDRPIVLYVCSSHFVAPNEIAFLRRWLDALRAHGGLLAEAGVIARPHPRNAAQWGRSTIEAPQFGVWPRFGEEPLEDSSRRNYFDSIHHAAAVVGINTSAQIESAIVGRPVHTVLAEEYRDTQQGTLHFHYLNADEFGLLHVGRTMDEHLEQLEESVRGRPDDGRNERFLRRFVRPLGLDVPASPVVVGRIERLAASPAPAPDRGGTAAGLVRLGLRPIVALTARGQAERRREKAKTLTPIEELRRRVRRLGRDEDGPPVVAGPWVDDQIGELLFWIPFLRWAQSVTVGMRGRLVVLARPESAAWYEGIGLRCFSTAEVAGLDAAREALGADEVVELPTTTVDDLRAELARQRPGGRPLNRPLEFALLDPPELGGVDLPEDFVAVRFENAELGASVVAELERSRTVVAIGDELLPRAEAIVARSSGFAGSYGVLPYLASLHGVPSVALHSDPGHVAEDHVTLATSFFAWPPFGRFTVLEADATAAVRISELLAEGAPVTA
ncbi:MAG: hypothetical protein ACM3QU_03190 [Verrucomicrobiota bacterium]